MQEAKKILVLSSTYPSKNSSVFQPGFVHNLCKTLKKMGYEIDVLAPYISGSLPIEELDGVKIYRYTYFFKKFSYLTRSGGIIGNINKNPFLLLMVPFFILAQFIYIKKLVKKNHYHLVHAHWIIPQGFIALLAVKNRIPILVTSHGSDLYGLGGAVFKYIKSYVIRHIEKLTVVAKPMQDYCVKNFLIHSSDVPVLGMGVDSSIFFSGEFKKSKELNILFVGRLIKSKGIGDLVKVLSEMKNIPFKLLVIGDGPYKKDLIEMIYQYSLHDKVFLTGFLSAHDIAKYYQRSNLLVMPSLLNEGLGLVMVEAMSCGCPVLAANFPSARELIKDEENGFLFDQGNLISLKSKLTSIFSNLEVLEAVAAKALDTAKGYSLQNAASGYAKLYDQIIQK